MAPWELLGKGLWMPVQGCRLTTRQPPQPHLQPVGRVAAAQQQQKQLQQRSRVGARVADCLLVPPAAMHCHTRFRADPSASWLLCGQTWVPGGRRCPRCRSGRCETLHGTTSVQHATLKASCATAPKTWGCG